MSAPPVPDPRRWITLAVVVVAVLIVVLDNTVLNVAIPTILRDFDTTLPEPAVGHHRLRADVRQPPDHRRPPRRHLRAPAHLHHRRRALRRSARCSPRSSSDVPSSIVGEAIIEGIGASLMLPGDAGDPLHHVPRARARRPRSRRGARRSARRSRSGPLLGGFLTTNYSWRWAFRINVIVAPLAIIGALLFMRRDRPARPARAHRRPGRAASSPSGMFLLVFALSEGAHVRLVPPARGVQRSPGAEVWPATAASRSSRSSFAARGRACSFAFYASSGGRSAHDRDPLFEFGQLRHLGFRYGLHHHAACSRWARSAVLRAARLPAGRPAPHRGDQRVLAAAVRRVHRHRVAARRLPHPRTSGVARVVQLGLALEVVGLVVGRVRRRPEHDASSTCSRRTALFGLGIGFASSQLTNVILSDIPAEKSGVGERHQHHRAPGRRRARRRGRRLRVRQPHDVAHDRRGEVGRPPRVAARHRGGRRARAGRVVPGAARHIRRRRRRAEPRAGRPASPRRSGRRCCSPPASCSVGAFLSLLLPRTPPVLGDHEPFDRVAGALEPVEPDPAAVLMRDV